MSFRAAGELIVEAATVGLYKSGTRVLAKSEPLVPVETGTLKRSGDVEQPVVESDLVSVTVGYGYGDELNPISNEPASGYAIFVHERLDVVHPYGQAKFLEDAARDFEPEFAATVAGEIRARQI